MENREAWWLAQRHTANVRQDSCLGEPGRGRLMMVLAEKEWSWEEVR